MIPTAQQQPAFDSMEKQQLDKLQENLRAGSLSQGGIDFAFLSYCSVLRQEQVAEDTRAILKAMEVQSSVVAKRSKWTMVLMVAFVLAILLKAIIGWLFTLLALFSRAGQ